MEYVNEGVRLLEPSPRESLRDFTISQMTCEGGFADRDGNTDLYYTVFGLQLLEALHIEIPYERVAGFLQGLYPGIEDMDLLDAASLGRCFGCLPLEYKIGGIGDRIAERISAFVSLDGGYAMIEGQENGSIYAAFLAMGAQQDMGLTLTNPRGLVASIESLALANGSYVNDQTMPLGLVPSTAAAIVMLDILVGTVPELAAEWLKSCSCSEGGISAVPGGDPDLLSTGVGLYAMVKCGMDISDMKYDIGRFLEALLQEGGGYCGSSDDKTSDCEYTYYGLLTKGIISTDK